MRFLPHRYDYDLIVIGGGSAGIVAGVMAGAVGLRVLVAEGGKLGGVCSNTGCVPSKALLHCAHVAHAMRTAGDIGLAPAPVTLADTAGVMARVRTIIRQASEADGSAGLLVDNGAELVYRRARFVDPHTVALTGGHGPGAARSAWPGDAGDAGDAQRATAERFLIATGSRPALPGVAGLAGCAPLTSDTVFNLDAVPASLCVIGGGPVGVELAQAFHRLGSRVTLLAAAERLLPRDDAEMGRALEGFLRGEGIDIRLATRAVAARRDASGDCVIATAAADGGGDGGGGGGGGRGEVRCERVLAAAGRAINVEGLGLDAAGVEYDEERIAVDAELRTSARHIYAAGDVLGHDPFSHMAEYEAKTAVRNIAFPGRKAAEFRIDPWATFTDPEVVHLGLTEEQARERGVSYEVTRQEFAQNDRALADNAGRGFVKVLTQGIGGRILGAHIIGPRGSELMQEWILAMQQNLPVRALADMIHVYPTYSMASQHAAQRWYEMQGRKPLARAALGAYARVARPYGPALLAAAAAAAAAAAVGGWGALGAWRGRRGPSR